MLDWVQDMGELSKYKMKQEVILKVLFDKEIDQNKDLLTIPIVAVVAVVLNLNPVWDPVLQVILEEDDEVLI